MKENLFREKIEEFSCYFHNLWSYSKPLFKLFRTATNRYLYDTGTNKIFACSELEFTLLHNLMTMDVGDALNKTELSCHPKEFQQTLEGIRASIERNNILKTKKAKRFGLSSHYKQLEELIQNSLGMIQLEITERCNLRCSYCLYNSHYKEKRQHGIRDMSLDTAIRAIDHLAQSSRNKKDVAVTFYGGEPLLRFPFIQSCVQYARQTLSSKNLYFSLTTNATLVTPEIANFLAEEEIGVHVSLDGPEVIHNQYRKDINGNGSFQKTILGLKTLIDVYGDQKEKITLSMVYTPPFSAEKLDCVSKLWDEISWLPRGISLNISYAQGFFPKDKNKISYNRRDFSLFEWAKNNFVENYERGRKAHPIASNFIEKKLANLVQRRIMTTPLGRYNLNGCCIPASRKLFVSQDGAFSICERIGVAPEIGNVFTGININKVKNFYVKKYEKESLKFCSECWALQLCEICYIHTFHKGQIDLHMKNRFCSAQRHFASKILELYCFLLEINKDGLNYLTDWRIY